MSKFADDLGSRDYASIAVALGRKERWALVDELLRYARRERGVEFTAAAFLGMAGHRLEEGHVDRALELLASMRHLGVRPHGDAVDGLAKFTRVYASVVAQPKLLWDTVAWVRCTDAGRALWDTLYSQAGAPGGGTGDGGDYGEGVRLTWRSQGLVMEAQDLGSIPVERLQARAQARPETHCAASAGAPSADGRACGDGSAGDFEGQRGRRGAACSAQAEANITCGASGHGG